MNAESLDNLLTKLCSSDNALRNAGEKELDTVITKQPGELLVGLAQLLVVHPNMVFRSFSSILLRKLSMKQVGDRTLIEQLGQPVLSQIQQFLIQSLQQEQDQPVRNKVTDTVSSLAAFLLIKKGDWPELFQVCGEFVSSPQSMHRKSAFLIFSGCTTFFTRQDQNYVKNLLVHGLQDQDGQVKLAALRSTVNYLCLAKKAVRDGLADLLPLMLNVIPPLLAAGSENDAIEGLGDIIELASVYPKMFKPILPQTVEYMLSQMKNVDLEDSTRQTCLELLITLCEGAPGLMRNHEPFARSVIPVMLEWMSELSDDSDWYNGERLEDEDETSNETVAEQGMDRLAIYLGGNVVLPIAFNLIPTLLASPEWNKRHAALRCISAIGEGCHKIMDAELDKVVNIVLPHLRDPHPRVRHAACNSIGQMCTDFAPKIQKKFHQPILANLIPIMDDLQHIRVANYGAAALVNFFENASKESVTPYIESIIAKLLVLMNTGKTFVQEQAVTTLATVAESAGVEFSNYYGSIMPVVLQILRLPNDKELRSLKGKALECGSLIILSVGKPVFAPDAIPFIEVLKGIQDSIKDADDPQSSYLLSAWARVCKVMGAEFAPYLEVVLPPLLKTAQIQPELIAFEDDDNDQYKEEDGWEVTSFGDKNVAIKTSAIDDKCTAVEMILCYAQEMGPIFHPYVEHIIKIVAPMLKFYLNDNVKFAAANSIPVLLNCWRKAQYPQEQITTLWSYALGVILGALEEEDDIACICALYNSIADSIKVVGPTALAPAQITLLTQDVMKQLEQYLIRNAERQRAREADDYDPADEEALRDEEFGDDQFLADTAGLLTALFKVFGSNFLPFFEQLLPKFSEFLASSENSSKQWALGVFCDLIEFTGADSIKYQEYFLQQMGNALNDPAPEIRQPAAYGIGVAAKFGGPAYSTFCIASIEHLFRIVNDPDSRSEDNVMATENAISALGKIIRVYKDTGAIDAANPISRWLQTLPITEDDAETEDVYSFFLELLDPRHNIATNAEALPHLISIATKALVSPGLGFEEKPELKQRLIDSVRALLANCDANARQILGSMLDSTQIQFLVSAGLS